MSRNSSLSSSSIPKNKENEAPTLKTKQNSQNESLQGNNNILQRIAARLTRVEEKFSHYPVIENYLQNNKLSTSTLEEKFKFIEFAGSKLNEQSLKTDQHLLMSIEDSVLMIEKQLFNNTIFPQNDLQNRILRIGSFQESTYKAIKQQIDNLISDPNITLDVMKQFLSNISDHMNNQIQIPNNDTDNIDTLKHITKVIYSPQSSIEILRDSLKKSLRIQQNSQTKIQELQRKTIFLEDQLRLATEACQQQQQIQQHEDDTYDDFSNRTHVNSTQNKPIRSQIRANPNPRKSRAFDLDDDCEMDSFALREAFEPEIKDKYQDHLEMMNEQLRSHGLSRRDIETANEIFKDCFIDLRSKILVQQDAISSLEKDKMQSISIRDKLAQQEAMIRKLQTTLRESVRENPEYKKQLKNVQLLTVKLNQAKNKIVFNQESLNKMKNQLQQKEDQRKRVEIENKNLKKDIEYINRALDSSNSDLENLKSLELKSKGIKGLIEKLNKTEKLCEEQQERMYNMHELILRLRNKLNSNGIQSMNDQEIESFIQKSRRKNSVVNEAASYTASFNDHSIVIDDDKASTCSQNQQLTRNSNNQIISNQRLSKQSSQNDDLNIVVNNYAIDNDGSLLDEPEKIKNINNPNSTLRTENNQLRNIVANNEVIGSDGNSLEEPGNRNNTIPGNDRLKNTLDQKEGEERNICEGKIGTSNQVLHESDQDKQKLRNILLKQITLMGNMESKFNNLQLETEMKLTSMTKKVIEVGEEFKGFISICNGLGYSSPKDRKTIEELSQLLQVANNTITTLRKEKDSLLKILCSEANRSKVPDKIDNKLTKDSSTDRFQLNLQQIDEHVTYQLDDFKNVKYSILNENQKEAL